MPFTDNRRFKAKPQLVASAKDMYYTTAEGKQVLDGLATLWCVNAGHGRPRIVEAIRKQAGELDFAASFSLGHPLAVPARRAHRRARAEGHGPRVLHQLGLRGGRHRAQDRGRLPPPARRGHAHALRRPRALVPRRQHRRHLGRRRAVQPQGVQRHACCPASTICATRTICRRIAFSKGQPPNGAELADELEERIIALHDASNIAAVIVDPVSALGRRADSAEGLSRARCARSARATASC